MGLASYTIRRAILLAFVLLGVVTLTFFLAYMVPGDPARLMAGSHATGEQVLAMRKRLGLDKPLYEQYLIYLQRLLKGDMGTSIDSRQPVAEELTSYFQATFELTTFSMFFAIAVGVVLGILSALKKDKITDHLSRLTCLSGVAMPSFWFAMLLQLLMARILGWFPLGDRVDASVFAAHPLTQITGMYILDSILTLNIPVLISALQHIALPSFVLFFRALAVQARMVRASMLDVLRQDYVRTARAYGLPERMVVFKYALKNALIPSVTVAGLSYGWLLAGALLVESIFSWPGLGRYVAWGILNADYPVILGASLLMAVLYMVINFIVDLTYAFLDPKIKYR